MSQFEGYLDAAATAPLRPEARAAMLEVLDEGPGNPSSVHAFGHRAEAHLTAARRTISKFFGARESEVIFTSGGTEANNLAVIGLALAHPRGRHILTSALEHPSVLEACAMLERVFGFEVQQVPVGAAGLMRPEAVQALLRENTTLVTLGLANAEIGTVQPVPEVIALAHHVGALVHTDAVQAAASLPVSFAVDAWPGAVDAMTIASHKFGGPQGVGALLLRAGTPIEPLLYGGGQEFGHRSGTQNVAGIAGFAAAVTATSVRLGSRALALAQSRDALIARVLAEVPGAELTGDAAERLPGHASFVVAGVSGESLLVALDAAGVAASSGSACAAGKDEPSPALLAMGLSAELAQTALRFTLFQPLSDELVERIVSVLVSEVRGR
ncbi:cysteine desulfurase family protein [Leucobacter sp. UT-8R-CII-1-4]|uniref:cysteine desulfurase family protein n=1 Tax=Leucobacter sp. UT-8R-CII-1-4 TaxID=3040075 RepID=UPI0024A89765|nr:cysteine desulfurase family protein [Leucobacter sp. UT-8R-CII-1-4]MDI6022282.1 cysteine desulfurase family protein [Leucobacter sp. UT-8R-CII-1-4]